MGGTVYVDQAEAQAGDAVEVAPPVPQAFLDLYQGGQLPKLRELRDDAKRLRALEVLLESYPEALLERQRAVLVRVVGLRGAKLESLSDVAKDLEVSKERVHAIVKQALKRLYKAAAKVGLEPEDTDDTLGNSADLQLYQGDPTERATRLARTSQEDLRREAVAACQSRNTEKLWALTDAYLTLHGGKGSKVSERTRENYRRGVLDLLEDWAHENLVRPSRDAGVVWVRELEQKPVVHQHTGEPKLEPDGSVKTLSPATVQVKLAAARTFYKALRWAGATQATPFADVKVAKDPVAPWEKRGAYSVEDVERLLEVADDADEVMILLGAHAGLRIAEISALRWRDIDWRAGELIVRKGKGGKTGRVALTKRLKEALAALGRDASESNSFVLPYRAYRARERFQRVCLQAGVSYEGKAVHGLRHGAGTRVYKQFNDLARVAQHLRQANLETARRYAKMNDREIHEGIEEW